MVIGFGSRPILPRLCRCPQPNFTQYIVVTATLIYFVSYHIINCVKEHRIIGGEENYGLERTRRRRRLEWTLAWTRALQQSATVAETGMGIR